MRLIDADAVANQIKDATDGVEDEFPTDEQVKPFMCGVRLSECFIDNAPTIDAVPVVRCKDCASFRYSGMGGDNGITYCARLIMTEMQPTDFCSYGERGNND